MTSVPLHTESYQTPFGELNVLVTPEDSVVRAAGFRPLGEVAAGLAVGLAARGWESAQIPATRSAVEAWLAGESDALEEVAVDQPGGPFFQEVWAALRSVPAGEVVSYLELAQMAGRPRAMRAVGTACGSNSIALFVPCHRVIQSGGRLGSYGFGGPAVKAAMLEHEGLIVASGEPNALVAVPR